MASPGSASPTPKVPIGNRAADYVEKMLSTDHHIFTEDFPATAENVDSVVAELRGFAGCYHQPTNSFSLDKIADWVIRNLEKFRQAQMSGAPTDHIGASPLLDAVEGPPSAEGSGPGGSPAKGPEGTLSNPRTIHAPPVRPPSGGAPRPQGTAPGGRAGSGSTTRRVPSGRSGAASPPGASSRRSLPASTRPPSEKTERRLVDLTKRSHELNREIARLEGEVKLYRESWLMLAHTMGLEVEGEGVAEVVIEGVASLETAMEDTSQERDELLKRVHSLENSPPQDLVKILGAFPPVVTKALGPDRVGEDLVGRIERAVEALASKGVLDSRQVGKQRKEFESVEKRLREELGWMTSERERARKERDSADDQKKKAVEKAAASLKMMEQFRQKVAGLEEKLSGLGEGGGPAPAPGKDGSDAASLERDRLWEVLGELVGEVAGRVKELESTQGALEKISGRLQKVSPPEPDDSPGDAPEEAAAETPDPASPGAPDPVMEETPGGNPLLDAEEEDKGRPVGPYEPGAPSPSPGQESTPKDQQTDEVHAERP